MVGSFKPQVIEIWSGFFRSFSAILVSRVLTVLTDYHANLAHRNMESPPVEVEPGTRENMLVQSVWWVGFAFSTIDH